MSIVSDIFAGGAKGVFEGIRSVVGAFKADPTEVAKLTAAIAQAELDTEAKIIAAESAAIAAVNATMQAEARSEHWMQWSWRPTIGLTLAAVVLNNYVLYSYLAKLGVVQIVIPDQMWLMFGAVLGVAAWVRGRDRKPNGNGA